MDLDCDSPFCYVDTLRLYDKVYHIIGHCNPDSEYSYEPFVYCSRKCAKQGYYFRLGFEAGQEDMKEKIKNL